MDTIAALKSPNCTFDMICMQTFPKSFKIVLISIRRNLTIGHLRGTAVPSGQKWPSGHIIWLELDDPCMQ
jgi:hypothetical protein